MTSVKPRNPAWRVAMTFLLLLLPRLGSPHDVDQRNAPNSSALARTAWRDALLEADMTPPPPPMATAWQLRGNCAATARLLVATCSRHAVYWAHGGRCEGKQIQRICAGIASISVVLRHHGLVIKRMPFLLFCQAFRAISGFCKSVQCNSLRKCVHPKTAS